MHRQAALHRVRDSILCPGRSAARSDALQNRDRYATNAIDAAAAEGTASEAIPHLRCTAKR
ncbi:MAG TPA: hypothetical protein VGD36_02505, partial [Xanthobacteraceae bacterium]